MALKSRTISSAQKKTVALAALLVAVLALVGYTLAPETISDAQLAANAQTDAKAQRLSMAPPVTAAAKVRVAYLGDSLTSGTKLGGLGAKGWPAIIAEHHGWTPHIAAIGGSGFVNEGIGGKGTFSSRVDDVAASKPDIVIIAGGMNDVQFSQSRENVSARTTLKALHRRLPKAKIVMIGPLYTKQKTDPGLAGVHAALETATSETKVMWVDSTGWFDGRTSLIAKDGALPTDRGHAYIAAKVEAALQKLGVV